MFAVIFTVIRYFLLYENRDLFPIFTKTSLFCNARGHLCAIQKQVVGQMFARRKKSQVTDSQSDSGVQLFRKAFSGRNLNNIHIAPLGSILIHVLVADDHPIVRSGLKHVLQQESDFGPPGEAENSEEVLQRIDEQSWDLIVLDIAMPGKSGLETLSEIRRRRPALPVLVLSMHAEELFALRAIKAGANGYLMKNSPPSELMKAIRRVLGGKKYVSPGLAEVLANAVESGADRPLHELLSEREYHVVCRIASGKSVSEIAEETALSIKTISTYRARALEKMKMRTNSELTRYAIRIGLVE